MLIFVLALLGGCSKEFQRDVLPPYKKRQYYLATLRFTPVEKNIWNIIAPQAGYRPAANSIPAGTYSALLPQYFSTEDVISYPFGVKFDFFYATYPLTDRELAMFISVVGPSGTRKYDLIGWSGEMIGEKIFTNNSCASRKLVGVTASFNAVDVDFDTASLYLVRNGEKTAGTLIMGKGDILMDIQKYMHNTYNVASTATISKMQMYEVDRYGRRRAFYNYPTFHYIFELACTDIEDATLVIDGLYHKGERLAPLKVRMNYADFSKAPKYIGPKPMM